MTREESDDPHRWLEDIEGEAALEQVRTWNARTLRKLQGDPRFADLEAAALRIVHAQDRIPFGNYRGDRVYNFWQDDTHVRGLLRRTSLESYLAQETNWESLLDIDDLAAREGANWVYGGSSGLPPHYVRCMLTLSHGGKDAAEQREWDHDTKSFVHRGFFLPEAKGSSVWLDPDTLLVATNWGPGTMTESGYPFIIRRLKRGQRLEEAKEIIRGEPTDVGMWPFRIEGDDGPTFIAVRAETFFESRYYVLPMGGAPIPLPLPRKANPRAMFKGEFVFVTEEDWSPNEDAATYVKGSLLSFSLADFMNEPRRVPALKTLLVPGPRASIEGADASRSKLIVTTLENVVGSAQVFDFASGAWTSEALNLPQNGSIGVVSAHRQTDTAFVHTEGFLTPGTLTALDVSAGRRLGKKAAPARFDGEGLIVEQFEAASSDGTSIPYFVIRRDGLALDGSHPTLLYGYGGFNVSLTPAYSALRGKLWLERGGVYVQANIRGGGEFGPAWHQAGLKTKRQVVYDDFVAVAEDLIAQKITRPRRLGIMGGSNGGLLMGVMYTQRPDLWNAVVCQVPLLDMLRYHVLLAGASWVDEYGSPEVEEERAFLERLSPYHNVDPAAEHPDIFFVTSTKDDRVHPGHARKMAALLEANGKAFEYYENIDGGHSAAANLKETAKRVALEYTWLTRKLMDEG